MVQLDRRPRSGLQYLFFSAHLSSGVPHGLIQDPLLFSVCECLLGHFHLLGRLPTVLICSHHMLMLKPMLEYFICNCLMTTTPISDCIQTNGKIPRFFPETQRDLPSPAPEADFTRYNVCQDGDLGTKIVVLIF